MQSLTMLIIIHLAFAMQQGDLYQSRDKRPRCSLEALRALLVWPAVTLPLKSRNTVRAVRYAFGCLPLIIGRDACIDSLNSAPDHANLLHRAEGLVGH